MAARSSRFIRQPLERKLNGIINRVAGLAGHLIPLQGPVGRLLIGPNIGHYGSMEPIVFTVRYVGFSLRQADAIHPLSSSHCQPFGWS
jgi:hypothetical protein